ncbi:hypothetical protein [Thioclava electrotropha]|uniref:Uncharacterized protein n=1 Tax=Thioclava electrotropha TaxID=1549850 RepID=A0ABX6YNP1_9RHOB|nr:hypothetical protein [Thioclava electrotropha]QPZ89441.1 hypothetical protein AKL02_000175 [Thioclava electrotropha]
MFDALVDILKAWGMSFSPMEDLITGPLSDLHSQIEAIANVDPLSPAVPAALGAKGLPDLSLYESQRHAHPEGE